MVWASMDDEELLRYVEVAGSECDALVLELARRLNKRIDEEFSEIDVKGDGREVLGPESVLNGLRALFEGIEEDSGMPGLVQLADDLEEDYGFDGLAKLAQRLEADVRELVDENDALREQVARREDDTRTPRRTHRQVALELLPEVGASMLSHTLSKRLAKLADTNKNVAGNAIRKLIEDGIFRSEGGGSSRTITRARSEST